MKIVEVKNPRVTHENDGHMTFVIEDDKGRTVERTYHVTDLELPDNQAFLDPIFRAIYFSIQKVEATTKEDIMSISNETI